MSRFFIVHCVYLAVTLSFT